MKNTTRTIPNEGTPMKARSFVAMVVTIVLVFSAVGCSHLPRQAGISS